MLMIWEKTAFYSLEKSLDFRGHSNHVLIASRVETWMKWETLADYWSTFGVQHSFPQLLTFADGELCPWALQGADPCAATLCMRARLRASLCAQIHPMMPSRFKKGVFSWEILSEVRAASFWPVQQYDGVTHGSVHVVSPSNCLSHILTQSAHQSCSCWWSVHPPIH